MRRVAITGLGTVNALGPDVATSWPRMLAGENGVSPITRFEADDLPVRFAASADWNPEEMFAGPDFRKLDPFTMLALKSAEEALEDGRLQEARHRQKYCRGEDSDSRRCWIDTDIVLEGVQQTLD